MTDEVAVNEQEETVSLSDFIIQLLLSGEKPDDVANRLVEMGVEQKEALEIVNSYSDSIKSARKKDLRDQGSKDILIGLLLIGAGVGLTVAFSSGTGVVVFWGAALVGAVKFFQGLFRIIFV